MDLEEFEVNHRGSVATTNDATSSLSIPDALKWIDAEWHTASRRARWMDLLGDYAGTEPFIIDGHSLIQLVIDDPLLALGKTGDPSFQILHAFHTLERTLDQFIKRSAVFDVVFWDENRHVALKRGVGAFEEASRSLARKLLFNHLLKIRQVSVYVFTGLSDPQWREYLFLRKPMFALVNDGGRDQDSIDPFATKRLLCHRVFLCNLLTSGLALALLAGAEFRDSKVLSFVYESKSRRADGFIPASVRSAYSTAARVLEGEAEDFALVPSPTSIDPLPALRALAIEDIVLKVASLTRFHDARNKALLFAFLIHLTLLPHLSTQERARRLEPMKAGFKHQLASSFLPNIFHAMEVAITSLNTTIDIDVRVFIALVRFLAENNTYSVQDIFGNEATKIVQDRLSLFSVPISTFSQFSVEFLLFPSLASPPIENGLGLLPFSNKIFDDELAPIRNLSEDEGALGAHQIDETEKDEGMESKKGSDTDEWDTSSEEEETSASATKVLPEVPRTGYFDDGTLFNDTRHWHNHKKSLLPKHLGGEAPLKNATEWQRKKKLRADQRFMKTLHDQAATLTGASGAALHQLKIPPVGAASNQLPSKPQKQSYTRPAASKATQKQSKADVIREKNLAQKAQKQFTESIAWLAQRLHDLDSETSLSSLEKSLSDLRRNPRTSEPFVATELGLYRLHRLFQHWILDPERESASVRDKHGITALRTIKDILEVNYSTNDIRQCTQDILNVLGFSAYTDALTVASTTQEDRPLSFKFVKLVKSKTREPLHAFMRITEHPIEWQLRVFGEYMDRSMDSQADPRVSFKPDAWQRQVLDAIDDNKSLLVVAPTSAGKTFISYYAMEKVLRGSDEGVIVYVAPTKALVAQVAAEIYARFSKDLKGRSCWAIHTRDYRIHDPQSCQILVTVPDMLAIMMLSPPLTKVWTPRVKYIILDEIHTIGQQEGGSVWEQILLLAPCPIIGLSATVGAPEKFNTWLEAVQKAGGFQHTFVHHPHRYSHLRKFFYNIHEKPNSTFESISTHKSTGRMRYLHPIAMLAFGPRTIPSDLALEASDTSTLYRALAAHGDLPLSTLDMLDPLNFFPSDRLLQQKDVITYDAALKACLAPMVAQFDPRNTAASLYKVVVSLEDDTLSRVPTEVINTQPERADFRKNLIHLVCDLHAQGDLPAIFFNFDRSDCEIMAQTLLLALFAQEKKWRASNVEWQRKLAQFEEWLSRAKDRERAAARAAKNRVDPDEVKPETMEWQATFDPNAPLPQFSFAGQHTSYTPSMLEDELKQLARWTSTPQWALSCLRRGIAVHHSGMNKRYRTIVESLFRQGFICVIFATGTLALGINAPTKTSIFCGDSPYLTALMYRQCAGRAGRRGYDLLGKVVFYGLPMDRVQRLTLSKLPSLGASFPVTSTLVLRLFNLLEGSGYALAATSAIQRLFRLPQVSFGSEEGKHQLLHHLRFSIDYLRRARLLDEHGRPFNLFGIASHLYYTEPSNFALVTLLRHGVVHRICAQPSVIQAKRDFILLMSHLFGRRYFPGSYLKGENTAEIIKKSASMVILPPLLDDARRVLAAHEDEILRVFTGYALTYGSERSAELGPDTHLPLSGPEFAGTPTFHTATRFGAWLQETALRVVVRSLFVANSGHDDHFDSVSDLAKTARKGLSLNEHAIPSLAPIFAIPAGAGSGEDEDENGNRRSGQPNSKPHAHEFALNAYILDFYTHGQVQPLSEANAIRRGDVWFVLQEFDLTLKAVRGVLEQLIMRKPEGRGGSNTGEGEGEGVSDDLDSGFMDVEDPTEKDGEANDDDEGGTRAAQVGSVVGGVKPSWVSEKDWKVLQVVYEATEEFDEKFKAMWA
ncbi:P-loop containing nucleoside triphosphate hydrolase protein [Imleria badia]|nr:P-loop containing nucleoside triphosphate hydrolase protein [Imleria badia]